MVYLSRKLALTLVMSLLFSFVSLFPNSTPVKAEDDWIKITSPAKGDELCVGTIAMIRVEGRSGSFITRKIFEISKRSNPDMSNSADWETIFEENTTVEQRVIDCECPIEIKKEYVNDPNRIIRVRISTRGAVFAFNASVKVLISEKPVLNAVDWIDDKPLGNRKPLILVNGISLSFNVVDLENPVSKNNLFDLKPEEKQWDTLLVSLKDKQMFNNFKPYIYLYDSNDTDDTVPSEDGVILVAKFLERRLFEKNLNSNLHFIAHSMGGLVCRQFMLNNEDKVNRIIALFTPHHGSMLPNYPPNLLEINNGSGISNFLRDISWDKNYYDYNQDLVRAVGVRWDDKFKSGNSFLQNLNKYTSSNWKIIPYYGKKSELRLGKDILDVSLAGFVNTVLFIHWEVINSSLEKETDSKGIIGFNINDGVVPEPSAIGDKLGFQKLDRSFKNHDHIGWSNNDYKDENLFQSIASDLQVTLSHTPQPNPPSELLPAPTVKPAIKMDNGDIKLEWSELKDAGVYYVEVAQRKNYSLSVKTNDYSSPYQIWTIEVPKPYVAVPYAYFIDGTEYVWHVRAGSKSNVLGKYSSNGTITYSKNSFDFGPPEIVSPGASEEIIKVASQDLNNITLTWKLDTKYAGKVDHYTYELSTKPYWNKPYLLDYRGVNIPSSRRSETIQLKPGSYYWRVCSNDSSGKDNGWSVSSKFTLVYAPQAVCSNPAPKNFKVDQSCSPKKITLSWNTPQEDGCNLTGYELSYSFDGKKFQNKSKEGDIQYTIPLSNVVEEKEYVFEICAVYGDKKSATATTRTYFTCKECSKPPEKLSSPPVGKLDVAKKSIVFTWDEPLMQSSCKIKHYLVSYRKNGVEDPSLGSSTVSVSGVTLQKGLSQGFEYQIGVKAVNDVGPASGDPVWSNKVKFEFNCDPTAPGKPMAQNTSTLCTDGFMFFKWDASTVMGGCDPVFGYVVKAEYNKTPLNLVLNFTSSNMYKLPVDKAGLYRIQVIAGGKVESQWSDEVKYDCSSVNCTPPPTGLKLEPLGNKMVMSWVKPVISKTCSQIVKYKYRYYIEPKPATIDIKETTDTVVGSWYLSSGKATYCFQTKAVYSDGKESDWAPSNDKWEKITYTNNPTPNPPPKDCKPSSPVLNEPSVDCQNKILTITWSKSTVQSGCLGIARYMVYVQTNNGNSIPGIAVKEYYEFPVNIGDKIEVKVKAVADDNSESEFSKTINKIIDCGATSPPKTDCKPSRPGKPIGEHVTNSDLMKFTWAASSVPNGCKIKTYKYQYNFGGDPPDDTYDSKGEPFAIVKPIYKNTPGTYCFWVQAVTEDGAFSEWSEQGCFKYTPPSSPPSDSCTNPRPPSSIKLSMDCNTKLLKIEWTDSPDKANCSNLKYRYNLYLNNAKHSNGNLMTSPTQIEILENGTYYLEIASVVGEKVGKYERSQDNVVFDCEKKVPSKKIELITENGRMYDKNIKPGDFRLSWEGVDNWDNTDQNMKYVLKITNTSSPETFYEWHVSDGNSQVDWYPLVNPCTKPEGASLSLEFNSTYTWSVSLIDKNHQYPYIESDPRSFYTSSDPNNTITAPHSVQLEDAANSSKITCGQVCHVGNNQFNLGEFFFNAIVDCSARSADQTEIWYQEGQDQMKYLATANITPGGRAIVPCSLRPGDYVLYARAIDNVDDSGNPYPPAKVRVSSFKNVFDGCDVHIRIIAQALNLASDYEIQNQTSLPCIGNKFISNQHTSPSKDCCAKFHQDDPFDLALINSELWGGKRRR